MFKSPLIIIYIILLILKSIIYIITLILYQLKSYIKSLNVLNITTLTNN